MAMKITWRLRIRIIKEFLKEVRLNLARRIWKMRFARLERKVLDQINLIWARKILGVDPKKEVVVSIITLKKADRQKIQPFTMEDLPMLEDLQMQLWNLTKAMDTRK